jgi:hypothetical protein
LYDGNDANEMTQTFVNHNSAMWLISHGGPWRREAAFSHCCNLDHEIKIAAAAPIKKTTASEIGPRISGPNPPRLLASQLALFGFSPNAARVLAYWLSSRLVHTKCPSLKVPPVQYGIANASDAKSIAIASAIPARSVFMGLSPNFGLE